MAKEHRTGSMPPDVRARLKASRCTSNNETQEPVDAEKLFLEINRILKEESRNEIV